MNQNYRAPWSRPLRVATLLSVAVLALVVLLGVFAGPRHLLLWTVAMVYVPLLVIASAVACMVRGYTLTDSALEIMRPGWTTTLPLAGLKSVAGDAELFNRSWRFFGNGGLFSFTGWFWNRRLGRYRAFATDPGRAVILTWPGRVVVITPHDPQGFIVRVRKMLAMAAG